LCSAEERNLYRFGTTDFKIFKVNYYFNLGKRISNKINKKQALCDFKGAKNNFQVSGKLMGFSYENGGNQDVFKCKSCQIQF